MLSFQLILEQQDRQHFNAPETPYWLANGPRNPGHFPSSQLIKCLFSSASSIVYLKTNCLVLSAN
jgi:hypothetical protein